MQEELNYLSEKIEALNGMINARLKKHPWMNKSYHADTDLLQKEKRLLENILNALTIKNKQNK